MDPGAALPPGRYNDAMRKLGFILLRGLLSMAVGALVLIAVGQLFALTRASCDTICRPEYAGTYGALGGVLFAFIRERDRAAAEARARDDEEYASPG
jgi:hypothetical protein